MVSSTSPATVTSRTGRTPSSFYANVIASLTSRMSPSILDSTTPLAGSWIARPSTDDPSQSRVRRNSSQRDVPFAVAGTGANGDASLWFHRHHSGQPREGEPGDTRPWLHEIDRDVLALRDPELRLDETLDGIGEDQPDHQDGNGEADSEDRAAARSGWRVTLRACAPAVPRRREIQEVSRIDRR